MNTQHTCIFGDSRKMTEIGDETVHLAITSPPYWQLKDYGTVDQVGFNDSYENYINHLNLVWQECYRVLHPGCRLLINIGDQFARSVYYGRYKVIPIRTEIIKFCETIGFDYMGSIIWQKKTTMNTSGGASIMGSYPYPRNGIIEIDYEFILIFKKLGTPPKPTAEAKISSQISKEKWREYFSGHWYFTGARQDGHIATFPTELPKRAIEMFSFVGETILDPFLGSGTTSLAAMLTNRNSIGYEINEQFHPIIKAKLQENEQSLFNITVDYKKQERMKTNWKSEIQNLPYHFHDPIRIDKKINPRDMTFGSRVSMGDNGKSTTEYFSVKKIIEVDLWQLSTGVKIRLIGLIPKKAKEQAAREFLNKKLENSRIYLKFDKEKYDEHENLLVYAYMKNKTFLNAHLLKNGYAAVDHKIMFKHKSKFTKLANNGK